MEKLFKNTETQSLVYVLGALLVFLIAYIILITLLNKYGKSPKYLLPKETVKKISSPIFILFLSFLLRLTSLHQLLGITEFSFAIKKTCTILTIFSVTWLIIKLLKVVKKQVVHNYDINQEDNLKARKVYTQFNILERIIIFVVVIFAIGLALMSFESIREIGISVFASAGVAGIIIGFSAQKMIGTILAGIQIAITQPIKIDDVVVVQGEWGRIEDITLTYVVVQIWDKRRLVVPTTYFIETPFQNWTKTSSEILGTVFLYTDYNVPFDKLREEQTRILTGTDLWDGEVNVLQVTDSKPQSVEIRALMSAKDSSTAWDLRVYVREKLILFLQKNYPESIVRTRVQMENRKDTSSSEE
ncbi:small-conductance mechanosensitive channel [Saonia flava]|uniref:Small-conductance mechanosensitive channel n=1 Tax=Saonia flava TaxID=523696 RepID=A0A846QRI7_9FLAO|nr:mechanosensitive ion channel domain-containing protein [Saonia flava]NJB71626.1 small-conductance mechanosensitive channel [Saonia flava]